MTTRVIKLLSETIHCSTVSSSSFQVYPSEYAYRDDSVTRAESASANCRRYPPRDGGGGIVYIHCDGQELKLSDSDRGSNIEYTAISYYEWNTRSFGQLLFIFSTRVSEFLTTITLHYYSDSVRGRPRLRFYAVPDDFDVWYAPTINYPSVNVASVPPGGEPAGHRSVSININFNTKKVLMYKFSSSFSFALSEVEFFYCFASASTSKYLYAVCCILSFLYDSRLLNMYSSWDHYGNHDNYDRYFFHKRYCQ